MLFNNVLEKAKEDLKEIMGPNILTKSVDEIKKMMKPTLVYRRTEVQSYSTESEAEVKENFPFLLIPECVSVICS